MISRESRAYSISRRRFVCASLAASATVVGAPALLIGRNAWARGKEIYVGIWAGAQGEYITKNIVPQFEADFQCKVHLEEGNTLGQVAKVRAQRDNPRFTVMFVDDFAVDMLKQENLIDPLPVEDRSSFRSLDPRFLISDNHGVGIAVSISGLFYNPQSTKRPESYASLWLPANRKNITLSSIKTTGGMNFVIAAAAVATGKSLLEAQYLGDEGFKKLAELAPNVLNQYTTPSQAASLVAQGEVGIGGLSNSKWIYPYTRQGSAVDMAYAAEGSFPGVNCQVLVKNSPNQDVGLAFMERMLDPQVQKSLAEFSLSAPTIKDIKFDPEILRYIPYPADELDKRGIKELDWGYLNKVRADWVNKWNRALA